MVRGAVKNKYNKIIYATIQTKLRACDTHTHKFQIQFRAYIKRNPHFSLVISFTQKKKCISCYYYRTKSSQGWMKLRTTVQLSSAIQKKPPLKREDSFLKRFSTRQIPETQVRIYTNICAKSFIRIKVK